MLEHLRALREDKDLSQKEIAALLKQLALLHETSIDYLVGLTDERKPYPRAK